MARSARPVMATLLQSGAVAKRYPLLSSGGISLLASCQQVILGVHVVSPNAADLVHESIVVVIHIRASEPIAEERSCEDS